MKKQVVAGVIGVVFGLVLGFVIGQEYLKYQMRAEISKGMAHFAGLFGINKSVEEVKKTPISEKNEAIKKDSYKEVPFDPARMANEGYQKAKWGMTKQEVIDITGASSDENSKLLIHKTEIAGEDANIVYYFVNDRLCKTAIFIEKKTSNYDNYIQVYNKIESLLNEKYGKPKKSKKRKSNNPYISDGMAIATGSGYFFTNWETPESYISLVLKGDNYRISLVIHYESKKYMPIAEKERKEKNKNKL